MQLLPVNPLPSESRELMYLRAVASVHTPHLVARGALDELGLHLARWLDPRRPVTVVSDDTVAALYGERTCAALRAAGWSVGPMIHFPAGERSKSPETASALIDRLLELGVHRRGLLLALGGGVVTDTAGYVAATYMRGIDYVNVPTSLIGQVDAAIGGKVAVNHPRSKNFIGAFHHPEAVIVDPDLTRTLPLEELRNGLAEALKVAIIHDRALFEHMERHADALAHGADEAALDVVVARALRGKIALLEPDPFEADLRRPLNFGHTFAHPLEVAREFSMRHGYAVAVGMALSVRIALGRRVIGPRTAARVLGLMEQLELPTAAPPVDPLEVWEHVAVVRHIRGDALHYVLPAGIGATRIVDDLTREEMLSAWRSEAPCASA